MPKSNIKPITINPEYIEQAKEIFNQAYWFQAEVAPLTSKAFTDLIGDNFNSYPCFVYILDNQVVGFIKAIIYTTNWSTIAYAVSVNHQEQGIGFELVEFIKQYLKTSKTSYIEATTYSNQASEALLKKTGFTKTGTLPNKHFAFAGEVFVSFDMSIWYLQLN
jgi:RimJ/RimL family protein N-acetyltransferase